MGFCITLDLEGEPVILHVPPILTGALTYLIAAGQESARETLDAPDLDRVTQLAEHLAGQVDEQATCPAP